MLLQTRRVLQRQLLLLPLPQDKTQPLWPQPQQQQEEREAPPLQLPQLQQLTVHASLYHNLFHVECHQPM